MIPNTLKGGDIMATQSSFYDVLIALQHSLECKTHRESVPISSCIVNQNKVRQKHNEALQFLRSKLKYVGDKEFYVQNSMHK